MTEQEMLEQILEEEGTKVEIGQSGKAEDMAGRRRVQSFEDENFR